MWKVTDQWLEHGKEMGTTGRGSRWEGPASRRRLVLLRIGSCWTKPFFDDFTLLKEKETIVIRCNDCRLYAYEW